jgi:hypothetical protein
MKMLVRTLLGVSIVFSSALAAAAADLAAPIRLDSVQIAPTLNDGVESNPGLATIAFTNTAPVPATNITFDVLGYDGRVINQYEDAGTFTQGVTIRHTFPDHSIDTDQQIRVESVKFADGAVWTAPSAAGS